MDSNTADRITRLGSEKAQMKQLIEWHTDKHFVFSDIIIETTSPLHSKLLAVFQERLKHVESEINKE